METKIAEMDQATKAAIQAVNNALAKLPNSDTLQYQQIKTVEENIAAIETLMVDAKEKNAVDSDFVGLEKIDSLEQRIVELNEIKQKAILDAEDAISLLPALEDIDYLNLKETATKVTKALEAVQAAKSAGAVDSEITSLPTLSEVDKKLKDLKAAQQEAIQVANRLLDSLPPTSEVTYENLVDMQTLVADTKKAVEDAQAKGALDNELTRLSYLTEFDKHLTETMVKRKEAIDKVNNTLKEIPLVADISVENFEEVDIKLADATKRMSEAEALGAVKNDFIGYDNYLAVQTKVDLFEKDMNEAILIANNLIASIPEVNEIDYSNLVETQAKY